MRGSLDTNVILRFLLQDNAEQTAKINALLLKQNSSQLAVADLALVESVFVMQRYYDISRKDIAELLHRFMGLQAINCNRVLFDSALDIYVKHPALSFEDCCLATYAQLNNALPLYTFDKKLSRQTEQTVLVP